MGEKLKKKPGLREHLRRLLGIEDAGPAVAARAPRQRRTPPARDPIHGARLSLVGLGELREHLGDRWPELSERVHSLAQAVITRHLTPGDVFDAHGDDGYVVLFSQLSKIEADFKCRVIAKEIGAKLLGSDWGRLGAVDGVSIELGRQALASLDFDLALAAAIARGTPMPSEPPDAALPAGSIAPMAPMARIEHAGSDRIGVDRAEAPAPRAGGPGDGYEPIWDFRVQALLHFRLGRRTACDDLTPLAAAELDFASLSKVMLDVEQLARLGRRLPVVCPVHAGTLAAKAWRDQIVRVMKDFPAPLLKLVTLEAMTADAQVSDTAWPSDLDALCKELPGRCVVRVGPDANLSGLVRVRSIGQVNLELPVDFSAGKGALARLERFARESEAAKLPCGILGLTTRAMTLAASAAGFYQLSGPAVHPVVPALGHAVQFDLTSLYRDLLPAS
ncbi:MAG TPA: hypothetical protein VHZ26_03370 [Caulobacteraceae bacterium]|nr:hypothetical protein [Caulobacteraceae bacterium]